jgi:hypothetical protein
MNDLTEEFNSPQKPKCDWQTPELIDLGSAVDVSFGPGRGDDGGFGSPTLVSS